MGNPNRAIGLRTSAAAAGAPYWQLLRGLTDPILTPKVFCVSVALVTAVETELLLIKSATLGAPSATNLANRLDYLGAGDIRNGRVATAWSAAPTIGAATDALARVVLPAQIGASVTWEFQDGALEVDDGESLLLWNNSVGAGAVLDVTCIYEGN